MNNLDQMEQLKYNRMNWKVEFIIISTLLFQTFYVSHYNSNMIALVPVIMNWLVYIILFIVMYFSVSPAVLFKKLDNPKAYGSKRDLTESEILFFIEKGITRTGLFKLCILLIPVYLSLSISLFGSRIIIINLIVTTFLIASASLLIIRAIQFFIKARGFIVITFNQTINNGLIYNNPDDKRAIVDKQFGIGSTINFGSKDGRLILYVLLAIPVTVISMLYIALKLAGKL